MKKLAMSVLVVLVGCGSEFQQIDVSMGADAANEASEVDTQTTVQNDAITSVDVHTDAGADMQAVDSETSAPFEASADGGVDGADGSDGSDGDTVPTCEAEEIYPQTSPTCEKWIKSTPWPLERGCCRKETHTCGHVVSFSPFCVEAH
jgi:hypothetical protein